MRSWGREGAEAGDEGSLAQGVGRGWGSEVRGRGRGGRAAWLAASFPAGPAGSSGVGMEGAAPLGLGGLSAEWVAEGWWIGVGVLAIVWINRREGGREGEAKQTRSWPSRTYFPL